MMIRSSNFHAIGKGFLSETALLPLRIKRGKKKKKHYHDMWARLIFVGIVVAVYGGYWSWSWGHVRSGNDSLVVVTGINGGLGEDMAIHLAQKGFKVIGTVRQQAHADRIRAKEPRITVVVGDLTTSEGMQRLVDQVGGRSLAALVHNAALTSGRVPLELDDPIHYDEMHAINTNSVFRLTMSLLPSLKKDGRARIIFISSIAAEIAFPGSVLYTSTKRAGEALTLGIAAELYPWGVRGVVVRPGAFATENPIKNWGWTERASAKHARENSPYPGWWVKQVDGKSWQHEISRGRSPSIVSGAIEDVICSRYPPHIVPLYSLREQCISWAIWLLPASIVDAMMHKLGGYGQPPNVV